MIKVGDSLQADRMTEKQTYREKKQDVFVKHYATGGNKVRKCYLSDCATVSISYGSEVACIAKVI